MRDLPVIRSLWENSNGVFLGDDKPHGVVTVEKDWNLTTTSSIYGSDNKGPYRWFVRADGSQVETEIPNVKTISTSRSIDQDAGSCTITVYNQWMDLTGTASPDPSSLGNPGYLGFNFGSSPEASAGFSQTANVWANVLVPNALLRTYQGYGGYTDGVPDSYTSVITAGNIAITGVWFVDTVSTGTDGMITLKCRDAAKLLLEQHLMPPLTPDGLPLRYCRFLYEHILATEGDPGSPAVEPATVAASGQPVGTTYFDSTMERWGYVDSLHGHRFDAVSDGNNRTSSFSEGTFSPTAVFNRNFWEVRVNAEVNEIFINPSNSSMGTIWISVREGGSWVQRDDGRRIPWDDANNDGFSDSLAAGQPSSQPVRGPNIDIPYLRRVHVDNRGRWIRLPRRPLPTDPSVESDVYDVQRIRITSIGVWNSGIGPYVYRSTCQEINARLVQETPTEEGGTPAVPPTPGTPAQTIQHDGNIFDYTEIIKDLLLWAGFLFFESSPSGGADVHGLMQFTGTYPANCIEEDFFDKKSVMEAINAIRDILGFVFFITEDGGVRFHSPNWWSSGNTLGNGDRTFYIPDIRDELQLTTYSSQYADDTLRSEIIVGSTLPSETDDTTQFSRYQPDNNGILRGMVKPAIWINEIWQLPVEQAFTAAIIALHLNFQSRKGSLTALANPEIQINDQVRISERVSSESYIHYIRGMTTSMDLDAGTYTMSLSTNWLGEQDQWVFDAQYFVDNFSEQLTSLVGFDAGIDYLPAEPSGENTIAAVDGSFGSGIP